MDLCIPDACSITSTMSWWPFSKDLNQVSMVDNKKRLCWRGHQANMVEMTILLQSKLI